MSIRALVLTFFLVCNLSAFHASASGDRSRPQPRNYEERQKSRAEREELRRQNLAKKNQKPLRRQRQFDERAYTQPFSDQHNAHRHALWRHNYLVGIQNVADALAEVTEFLEEVKQSRIQGSGEFTKEDVEVLTKIQEDLQRKVTLGIATNEQEPSVALAPKTAEAPEVVMQTTADIANAVEAVAARHNDQVSTSVVVPQTAEQTTPMSHSKAVVQPAMQMKTPVAFAAHQSSQGKKNKKNRNGGHGGNGNGPTPIVTKQSEVMKYLIEEVKAQNIAEISATLALGHKYLGTDQAVEELASDVNQWPPALSEEQRQQMARELSDQQVDALGRFFEILSKPTYANPIILGPAGSGKTNIIKAVTAFLSYGVVPSALRERLRIPEDINFAPSVIPQFSAAARPFENVQRANIGQVDVVLISNELLGKDNTQEGQAFQSQEVRMQTILSHLMTAAKNEFNKRDLQGNRIGRRTLFVFDEFAHFAPVVKETLKTLVNPTGFKNPLDPITAREDVGYYAAPICTLEEWQKVIDGDAAIQRRYSPVVLREASESEAFQITRNKIDNEYSSTYGVQVDDEAIVSMIQMRRFFHNPRLAMPASILDITNQLITWFGSNRAPHENRVTLAHAQTFMMKKLGLTNVWFDGVNGELPGENLEHLLREHVSGQDEVVHAISRDIRRWMLNGFRGQLPLYALIGLTGSGKGTIHRALNKVLFGHDGSHLIFDMSQMDKDGFAEMSHKLALKLVSEPIGIVLFDEVDKCPSQTLARFNVMLEQGLLSMGEDDMRKASILFPVIFAGEYDGGLFEGKTDDEIDEIYDNLLQDQIEDMLLQGHDNGRFGKFIPSLVDRIQSQGLILFLRKLRNDVFRGMVERQVADVVDESKAINNREIVVSDALKDYMARVLEQTNQRGEKMLRQGASHAIRPRGARILRSIVTALTEGAISDAMIQARLPRANFTMMLDYQQDHNGHDYVIVTVAGVDQTIRLRAASLMKEKNPAVDCKVALSSK